jgi:hypothetical protein
MFPWQTQNFTDTGFDIKIDFKKPLFVSQSSPERLILTLLNDEFFFSSGDYQALDKKT